MKSGLYMTAKLRAALAAVLAALLLSACADTSAEPLSATEPQICSSSGNVFFFSYIPEEVPLCSLSAQYMYERRILVSQAVKHGKPYRPFTFDYCITGDGGTFFLGETSDLSDAATYPLVPEYNSLIIHNLKINTVYYYKILSAEFEQSGSFRTAQSPRFLSIPGTRNVRDIGGYQTQDGKTVRQGMLIRGAELDALQTDLYSVTAEDIAQTQEIFGFKFDMDLRSSQLAGDAYSSPLGPDVAHRFYNAPQYEQIFQRSFRTSVKEIFQDLAKPENYPMYLHCAWGKDRTGTVVFLLQGVLNMSESNMIREYRMSGFDDSFYATSTYLDPVIARLEHYPGDTLQEQIVSYLKTFAGITDSEIESIRSILLEE